jgi:hypothetical protein
MSSPEALTFVVGRWPRPLAASSGCGAPAHTGVDI